MNKKLPDIFKANISSLNNNEKVYYSNRGEENKEASVLIGTINQKINTIFSSTNYVYKADVKIILKDRTINTKVVGRNKTHLITLDNELVPIKDIVDIDYKKRND